MILMTTHKMTGQFMLLINIIIFALRKNTQYTA